MKFYTNVTRVGGKIFHRGYDDVGPFQNMESYCPKLFIPSKNSNTKFSSIHGTSVEEKEFESSWEMYKWVETHREIHGYKFYGTTNTVTTFIYDNYHGEIKFDSSKIRVGIIDIECAGLINSLTFVDDAPAAITTIALRCGHYRIGFGVKDFVAPKGYRYFKCKDEAAMLRAFLEVWTGLKLDVISGWNIISFDIPYLINRICVVLGPEAAASLSPVFKLQPREFQDGFRRRKTYDIVGMAVLDYMEIYKKFTLQVHGQLESYSLNFVSYFELDEKKIDYSEYGNLVELYEKNFQLYMEYNFHDTELVARLDNKLKFFDLIYEVAFYAKCNFQDVLKTIPVWESLIHAYLMDRRIVVPQKKEQTHSMSIPGGYVKEPIPGLYHWVVSFDVASLYPHLIMQYNLGPDTFLGKTKIPSVDEIVQGASVNTMDASMAATGCYYSRKKQGFLAELMHNLFDLRSIYKKEMIAAEKELEKSDTEENKKKVASLKAKQQAIKILANSGYGALCNEHFLFFSYDNAMSITISGQLSTKWIEMRFNEYMNKICGTEGKDYIIAADTDSIYVNCGPLVNKALPGIENVNTITNFLDAWAEKKAQKVIDQSFNDLAKKMNAYNPCLKMKREAIAKKGIWTGKKRYALNMFDKEGVRYDTPKLKVTGLEVVRSSTPEVCRDALEKSLEIIMNDTEDHLIEYVDDFHAKFLKMSFYEVAAPSGIKGIQKYYDPITLVKPHCPIHVRGAIVYNEFLINNNLTDKYLPIGDGDKIKMCYLKTPNNLRSDIISCSAKIPDELEIEKMIDYELQFEKKFLEPLKNIVQTIGWKLEKVHTIEGLFS